MKLCSPDPPWRKNYSPAVGRKVIRKLSVVSTFKVGLCCVESPCLRSYPSQSSSHLGIDQDGGVMAQPFCSYLRQTRQVVYLQRSLPGCLRLCEACIRICLPALQSCFPPFFHRGWSLISILCPNCFSDSDFNDFDQHSSQSCIDLEAFSLQWHRR